MNLVLEIEYLSGVSYAAAEAYGSTPEWPPQPDRVFSALVATWASHGQPREDADALEWLEQLPPPTILASDATPRTSPSVFVPPNDPRTTRQKNARGVLPALRSRQSRRFPAARPLDPCVRFVWTSANAPEATLRTLSRLAHDTSYIGHSASLTRCRFLVEAVSPQSEQRHDPLRRIYAGRFAELRRTFDSGRRPLPGARVTPVAAPAARVVSVFSDRWLLLEHLDGTMPDLRGSAMVSKTLRDALLSGYRRIGREQDIPEIISGHAADGAPTRLPHLAVVPLPFAGSQYADGHVLGFALVPPRDSSILDDEVFRSALRELAPHDPARGRRCLTLSTAAGTPRDRAFSILFSPTMEPSRQSLDSRLYTVPARTFATMTPIVLDRHLKLKNGGDLHAAIAEQIAAACHSIGLPTPVEVTPDKHPAIEGVPSAYPSGKSPRWARWVLPHSLASRQLTHAVLRFPTPVCGPVVIGAGRFVGMGFCRPVDGTRA